MITSPLICECGKTKQFATCEKCPSCYGRDGGRLNIEYDICACGRTKNIKHDSCRVCLGQPYPACDITYRPFGQREGYKEIGCSTQWPHAHCACGNPCAVNWPSCSVCESRSMGLSVHDPLFATTVGGVSGIYGLTSLLSRWYKD